MKMGPANIDSIPKPPYEGQGQPLPIELGLNGDWIIGEKLLLVRLSPKGKHGLVFGVHLGYGSYCEGIDADLLADQIDAIPDGATLGRVLIKREMSAFEVLKQTCTESPRNFAF
jgi:hypothetical protein